MYDKIPVGLSEERLDLELYKQEQQWEYDIAQQKVKIEEKQKESAANTPQFMELFKEYCSSVTQLSQASLAEYIVRRKAVIELLEKALESTDDGKYSRESQIHSIICPMQITSDDVQFDEMNLWLIDDRLAYHQFLASDQPMKTLPILKSDVTRRMDIAVFDKAISYSAEDDYINAITIVELKRPQRDDLRGDNKNPISQVLRYVSDIKSGKVKKANGCSFGQVENAAFYCYVIADITEVKNCNSILKGNIKVEEEKLNIKYGINGTGKTTIAKAIEVANDSEKLQELKSYFAEDSADVTINPPFEKVLVFNEEFVEQVVFKEDEVIENSFEVFLKTPTYDCKKEQLDQHLKLLHQIMENDLEVIKLQELLEKIGGKFKRTATGKLNRRGTMKSLLTKQNLYNVPNELKVYKKFFANKDINIQWIDWKNKGDTYDLEDRCPYCSERVNRIEHNRRKDIFQKNYTKTDSQNLKELLDLLESLEAYDKNNNNSILTIFKKLRVKGSVLDRFGEFLKGDKDKFYFDFFYMAESKDKENIEIIKEELGNYGLLLLIDYQARRNS